MIIVLMVAYSMKCHLKIVSDWGILDDLVPRTFWETVDAVF
jgi:hypothetical protein